MATRSNYYDTRNSFLNEVIERKTGIPITLSVVYIEAGETGRLAHCWRQHARAFSGAL